MFVCNERINCWRVSFPNSIDYVSISTGTAVDFGDLTVSRAFGAGCSNGHGGLG